MDSTCKVLMPSLDKKSVNTAALASCWVAAVGGAFYYL